MSSAVVRDAPGRALRRSTSHEPLAPAACIAFSHSLRVSALAALLAMGLAGCGGGGGSGTSAEASGPDAPTMSLWLSRETAASGGVYASEAADLTAASAAQMLQLAQFTTDLAHRLATLGEPLSVSTRCAGGGTVTLNLQDRDGNGFAGAGDSVTAVLAVCGLPVLQRRATGTVRVDIQASSISGPDADLRARLDLQGGLALDGLSGAFTTSTTLPVGTLTGALAVQWSSTETGSTLRAASTTEDLLRFDGPTVALAWRKLSVDKTVRFDDATVSSNWAFVVERAGARAVVTTPQPWTGDLNQQARSGLVQVRGANGRSLRLQPRSTPGLALAVDMVTDGGQVVGTDSTPWQADQAALVWDGRKLLSRRYPVAEGLTGDYVEMPRDIEAGAANGDLIALFPPTPGAQTSNSIDRLFLHPVLKSAGGAAAGATFRWQLGSALEDVQPTLFFRFRNFRESAGDILPQPSVAATVTRRGALYLVRPVESLSHGSTYELQSSLDANDWQPADFTNPAVLRKRNGDRVAAERTLAIFGTPNTLLATIERNSTVFVGPDDPAALRATVTASLGQGISSMRWEQLSGAPLVLETPNAATTRVTYAAGTLRNFDTSTLVFTVIDDLGNVERALVRVTAGDVASVGAALYTTATLATLPGQVFRSLELGGGAVLPGSPSAEFWALRLQPPPAFDSRFAVGAPNGEALQPGIYANSTLVVAEPDRPVMFCLIGLCSAPGGGSFEVLELVRGPDGAVTRMAVDFEQSAPSILDERLRGSYRFNSQIPVRR